MGKRAIKINKLLTPEQYEYSVSIENDKAKKKFIDRVEKIIRSSKEYKDYVAFLKEYVDMSRCAFFKNVSNKDTNKIKIEIHHEPFTLYSIVSAAVDRWTAEVVPLNDLYLADEVMELHYANKVGLVPLAKTIHQVVHNSFGFIIPLTIVSGNYIEFAKEYNEYINIDVLEQKINETKMVNGNSYDLLDVEFEYVEVDGFILPKKIEKQKVG